jgi:glucose-6-phosphate-specific signal transduction histidine kinase
MLQFFPQALLMPQIHRPAVICLYLPIYSPSHLYPWSFGPLVVTQVNGVNSVITLSPQVLYLG